MAVTLGNYSLGDFEFGNAPASGSSGSGPVGSFVDKAVSSLADAGLERLVSSINRPVKASDNPSGRLGKLGTVGVEVGLSPTVKTGLVLGGALLLGILIYTLTRK
jgi:hypothetical protein